MAVSKSKKADILENLKKNIKEAKSVSFTTNNGLTVDEISNLRKNLREINGTFTLAKKTLIKIAFKEVHGIEIDNSILNGQIALVISNDDPVSAMGKVNDLVKENKKTNKIVWAGSYFEGEIKGAEETNKIASIPSKDVLLGKLVGSMMSPISALARFFDAASKKLNDEGLEKLSSAKSTKKQEDKKEVKNDEKNEENIEKEEKTNEKKEKSEKNLKEDKKAE